MSNLRKLILEHTPQEIEILLKSEKQYSHVISFIHSNLNWLVQDLDRAKKTKLLVNYIVNNSLYEKYEGAFQALTHKVFVSVKNHGDNPNFYVLAAHFYEKANSQSLQDIVKNGKFPTLWNEIENKTISNKYFISILSMSSGKNFDDIVQSLGQPLVESFFKSVGYGIFNSIKSKNPSDLTLLSWLNLSELQGYKLKASTAHMFLDVQKKPVTFEKIVSSFTLSELENVIMPNITLRSAKENPQTHDRWTKTQRILERIILSQKVHNHFDFTKTDGKANKI